jgi:cell division protein FtsL
MLTRKVYTFTLVLKVFYTSVVIALLLDFTVYIGCY